MLNQCNFIGNLGRDAELKFTGNGEPFAKFSIACSEKFTDKASGEKKERTEWINVVLWGKAAESLSQYLVKGKSVFVSGKMTTRSWEDGGVKKYATEIRALEIKLLGGRSGNDSGGGNRGGQKYADGDVRNEYDQRPAQAATTDPGMEHGYPDDDDIPFSWVLPLLIPALGALQYAQPMLG